MLEIVHHLRLAWRVKTWTFSYMCRPATDFWLCSSINVDALSAGGFHICVSEQSFYLWNTFFFTSTPSAYIQRTWDEEKYNHHLLWLCSITSCSHRAKSCLASWDCTQDIVAVKTGGWLCLQHVFNSPQCANNYLSSHPQSWTSRWDMRWDQQLQLSLWQRLAFIF